MARKKAPKRLSKVTKHEHNLLFLLLVAQSKGLLASFCHLLEEMHGGLDYADLLMEQENLTIYSAFPWAQSGNEGQWKQLKNEIQYLAQYPTYNNGVENE